jgi:hypothetical protein
LRMGTRRNPGTLAESGGRRRGAKRMTELIVAYAPEHNVHPTVNG